MELNINGVMDTAYIYAKGSPLNYADPSGHAAETALDVLSAIDSAITLITTPSWLNAGMLLWDIGSVIIPLAPGSYVAKGEKLLGRADNAQDNLKEAERLADIKSQFTKFADAKDLRTGWWSSNGNTNTKLASELRDKADGNNNLSTPEMAELFGYGFSSKGYNPQPGERTLEGDVRSKASPEISLTTQSAGFNNNNGMVGGVFKRFGAESRSGISPHVYQPQRNVTPSGDIFGKVGIKTANGGVTSPTTKDVKQLYEYFNNGKYR